MRFVYLAGEAATLLLAVATFFAIEMFFRSGVERNLLQDQLSDAGKVDILFRSYFEENIEQFRVFSDLTDPSSAVSIMTVFSDIYFIGPDMRITRILKKSERSLVFEGFDLSKHRLCSFLKQAPLEDPVCSGVYRSAETDELSVYLARRLGGGYLVGRVGFERLRAHLKRIAEHIHGVIVIATKDGYVLSHSEDLLDLQVLPEARQGRLEVGGVEHYFSRKSSNVLDNDIVILAPVSILAPFSTGAWKLGLPFLGAIAVLLLLKALLQSVLVITPLTRFSAAVARWAPEQEDLPVPQRVTRVQEIQLLSDTFGEMAHRILSVIQQLRLSETQLGDALAIMRAAIEQSPSGIVIADVPDAKIRMVNAAALAIRGGEAAARTLTMATMSEFSREWQVFLPDGTPYPPEQLPLVRAVLKGDVTRGEEMIVRHESGEDRWVSANAAPIRNAEGEITSGIVIFHDITERKQAETEQRILQSQLVQSQKMESVGRLAGGVAHDFNNMLSVILGRTELALEQVDPAQPLHADLLEVQKAAQRSADLTQQLLAFARKQTVAPVVLDLNKTVEGTMRMLRRLIGEDIDLLWRPGTDLWPVKMDPVQVGQILTNLCVNARDAIRGVGKVTIETGNAIIDQAYCAEHSDAVCGEYAVLSFSDNGRGMSKEVMEHLFEPFFTTKGVGEGTGLGLATVYGIVKQNGGHINVYSEPGQGTTFKIYLPRYAAGPATLAPMEEPEQPLLRGRETILLVEDEPAILRLTTSMLKHLGYQVLPAGNPGVAVRLAEEHAGVIHLLMTDVVMPEMNGQDLAKRLSSLHPNLKCLFMSGYTANVIAHHGVLDEGVQFIQKPFSMKALANKIREALEQA